ncbi:MAG: hypothetical protein MN733_39925 [Nitrososphaera sp.]|nr:hypothetical protein [Nitrososphaera sp.]
MESDEKERLGNPEFQLAIRNLAEEAYKAYAWKQDDHNFYYNSDHPLVKAILAAAGHDCSLDYWRLIFVREALLLISKRGPSVTGQAMPGHATLEGLIDWLATDYRRASYVRVDRSMPPGSLQELLQGGQSYERGVVYVLVLQALVRWLTSNK